jgi:AAHS family 4-hydroxybenzoate transporter-like MFS transporter
MTEPGETTKQAVQASTLARQVNVRQFIDEQPFSAYQVLVVVICAVLVAMDGFDAQAMGFVAPAVVKQLHISKVVLGPVLAAGLFGMMIGAFIFGPLADRLGRKPILISCVLIFGVGALLTSMAHSVQALMTFRLFTGFGLGGAMPNAIALTAEYMPARARATGTTIMFCGFTLGGAAGGYVAAALIARFGWPAVFVVGGCFPFILALLLLMYLPESIRFLVIKGGEETRVARYLSKIAQPEKSASLREATFVIEKKSRQGAFLVKQLLLQGRRRMTLSLWVMMFMSLLDLYFLYSWMPILLNDAGITVQRAIIITTLLQLGGALGALSLGRIIDWLSSYHAISVSYFGAAIFIFCIGLAGVRTGLLVAAVFAAGFCIIGSQTCSNALAAEVYPTSIRSTGVGWALGIGRIGSMMGPLVGGLLLSMGGKPQHLFWFAALPAVVGSFTAFLIASQLGNLKQRVLE